MSQEKIVITGKMPEPSGEHREPRRSEAKRSAARPGPVRALPAVVAPPAAAGASASPSLDGPVPEIEVVLRPTRRVFTAEYKLRILREADACTAPGQVGALLRREALYSSHLTEWRRARDLGFKISASARKRGRKPKPVDPRARRVSELERENRILQEKLRRAELVIDFQKKVQALLALNEDGGTKS